jgi:hypothetical protein
MGKEHTRRVILYAGLGKALAYALPSFALADQTQDAIKRRIEEDTIIRKGTKYLQIGNGVELEIVDPKDTPAPREYQDPSKTGIPLLVIPDSSWLEKKVSKNFKLGEFAIIPSPEKNKGTGVHMFHVSGRTYNKFIRLDPLLVLKDQSLRDAYGNSVSTLSPYRTVTYNLRSDGKKLSLHQSGQATDLAGNPLTRLKELADKEFENNGVGKYPTFVHTDTRGYKARW